MATGSEKMGDGIDAVKMTRRIRDKRHERVKDMTREERLAYYQERGAAVHERFMDRIREEGEEAP